MSLYAFRPAQQVWQNRAPRQSVLGLQSTGSGGGGANQFTIANTQYFSISDNAALSHGTSSFLYCGWVNFDSVSVQQCVFNKGNAITGTGTEFTLWLLSTGQLRATISNGSATVSSSWGTTLVAATWYFVEAYYDSSTSRVRINVTPQSAGTRSGTSVGNASTGSWDSTFPFYFGTSGSTDYLGGKLASWAYYNAIPSTTVLDSLYNSGVNLTYASLTSTQKTNLVAWWDFGETSGNLLDKTGTGNDMTPSTSRPTLASSPSGVGSATSIGISTPLANQVIQRKSSTLGDIKITGTYLGSPTEIEAQFNGGAWKAINATGSNGVFSGTLTDQAVGSGTLSVRFQNSPTTTASLAIAGIGINIATWGQSNMSGRGTNNQTFTAGLAGAYLFGNDYTWKVLADPYDSSTSQVDTVSSDSGAGAGSVWPLICTALSASNAIPIGIIVCPKGGSEVGPTPGVGWQPGTDHQDRTTLYGSGVNRIRQVGGVELICWWQGETDMVNAKSTSYYQTQLSNVISSAWTDIGAPVMPCKVHTLGSAAGVSSTNQNNINNAIGNVWTSTPHALTGPDLTGITADSSDGLHLNSNTNLSAAANLWIPKIKTALGLS